MIFGMRYRSTNPTVDPATYNLIWCPQYRRRVLAGAVQQRLEERIGEVAGEVGAQVIEIEVTPDHVHRLVQVPPTVALPRLVQPVTGRSARMVRSALPRLRLWSPSWFVSTVPSDRVGGAPLEVVARSVENQKAGA